MGFFSSLFGKKEKQVDEAGGAAPASAAAAAPGGSWARRLQQAYAEMDDDEQKWALCEELLGELAPRIEGAKIKKIPDDDEIELRGRMGDTPVKVNLEVDMGWVRPEMKITNRTGELQLERDHEKIPQQRDPDDDWSDDDELRVFAAKGIFVEGDEEEVNETLGTLGQLPGGTGAELLAAMERLRINTVYAYRDSLSFNSGPNLQDMADPIAHIADLLAIMKKLADALASGERDMAGEPKVRITGAVEINGQRIAPTAGGFVAPAVVRVQCEYCSTLFVLGTVSNCPNCGATYTG